MLLQIDIISKLQYPHPGILLISWFVSLLIMPWLISASIKIGALDKPKEYKAHEKPIPFLGGVGILIAFSVGLLSTIRIPDAEANESVISFLFKPGFRQLSGIMLGALFVTALGIIDDFRPINAVVKLIALFTATMALYYFDIRLNIFPEVSHPVFIVLNVGLTLFWIVGVTSSLNSLDNMDGASAGVSAVAAIFIFIFAWGSSVEEAQRWLSFAAIGLLGAILGFLRYNFSPAKIYLGDNGSFLLGFLLASILVMGKWDSNPIKSIMMPCMILTVPLFDITISTIFRLQKRIIKGKNPLQTVKLAILFCGRDHTTHRLMALGLSKRKTALVIYAVGLIGGGFALAIRASHELALIAGIFALYLACLLVFAFVLSKANVYQTDPACQTVKSEN